MVDQPLVSIGLPVYNAARYLEQALDSLLGQDYPSVELIISDNASDDATEDICTAYAQRDRRIRYYRNPRNMGMVWNFNRVFELARGGYFMWAANDDLRDPRYLSECVAALQMRPEAVLCCTDVRFIDEDANEIHEPPSIVGIRPIGKTAGERMRKVVSAMHWTDLYSLVRADALRRTRVVVSAWGCDVILLVELCLRGPVVMVPEPLFTYRRYRAKTFQELAGGLQVAGGITVCWSEMALELMRAVWLAPHSLPTRVVLVVSLLMNCCVLNHYLGNAIRADLTSSIRTAVREKRFGRLAALLLIGCFIYPSYNRLTRALYRRVRPLRSEAARSVVG